MKNQDNSLSNMEILRILVRGGWVMEKHAMDEYIILRKGDFLWQLAYDLPPWALIEMLLRYGERKITKCGG